MAKDGGPAFPRVDTHWAQRWDGDSGGYSKTETMDDGMSLRDWFAGQFLATMRIGAPSDPAALARICYWMADAMIAEREK